MKTSISKPLVAGLIATTIMTIVMFMAPLMGLPKMNAAAMLSMMLGVPIFAGWLMHFMIGIIFAFGYSFIFARVLNKVNSTFLKGAIYGLIVFVFAQAMMFVMGLLMPIPQNNANIGLMMIGSIIGHIVFGIGVAEVVAERKSIGDSNLVNSKKEKNLKATLLSICLVVIISEFSLTSCSKDNVTNATNNTNSEFIANDSTFKDFMNWTLIKTIQGIDPFLAASGAHAGNDSTVVRKVYVKNNQDRVNGLFPVGTILVKHLSNPKGTVNEFTAKVQRGNNFNASGNDWEWFMLMADGTIAKQNGMQTRGANLMNGMCAGCHRGKISQDYVFSK